MHTYQSYLEQWLQQRIVQQQSIHTIDAYRRDILDFFKFCQQQDIDIQKLTHADIQYYLVQKIEYTQLQNKSLQRRLSAIRQFITWLNQQHQQNIAAAQDIKIKNKNKTLPAVMNEQLITQLLEQAEPLDNTQAEFWIRDKAMLELFYSSGLRLSELQGLIWQDIDFNQKLINVMGKGKKNRIVPFGKKANESLIQWREIYQQWLSALSEEQYKITAQQPVFISRKGDVLSTRQIENRVKYQAQRAGIAINLYPHLLRHSFASHLLNRSGDLRAVQEMLGHERASTTAIYTHLNFAEIQQKYQDCHPHARKK
ncbi:tyrosine-type recombinase/integrase [Moraxella sp. ZY210820]|uniref:tyrosine-type recombinase/integrase n=1 Tax=unclassified Moraxella TaxID=2685852 RepID=UPI00273104C6|nr:tyrosine-type recombinase/integrase [Moraxella sp. ZY210820]WLF84438.1 tyrosine-type recombinase/integrase [Moraxella sp. ZY210820]